MSLKDKISQDSAVRGTPCSVGRALDGLPPADRELFVELLGTPERRGRSAAYIYGIMQSERRDLHMAASKANEAGNRRKAADLQDLAIVYAVGLQTINRHRGRNCRCFTDPS